MTRADGRLPDRMRDVVITTGVQKDPAGSVQVRFGQTVVLVAASVEKRVPRWLEGLEPARGWITAEYAMLPGAVPGRATRRTRGRAEEIQRLVGRSLRAAADLTALPGHTITVDCDVLQADGGTRTASITGGWVALKLACGSLLTDGSIQKDPVIRQVCAVSCGIKDGTLLLDPDYGEDSSLDVDMNLVLTSEGRIVEIQGTAEGEPFEQRLLSGAVKLASTACSTLSRIQLEAL